jgi:hypothetical protein
MTEHLLGFALLNADAATDTDVPGVDGRIIGHIHGDEFFIVECADRTVVVVDQATSEIIPLNRDRGALEEFLAAFDEYVRTGTPASPATVMNASQAAERLALMRAGKLKPAAKQTPAISHKKRYKGLKKRLEATDRNALSDKSWWSGTLEQAKDDLI